MPPADVSHYALRQVDLAVGAPRHGASGGPTSGGPASGGASGGASDEVVPLRIRPTSGIRAGPAGPAPRAVPPGLSGADGHDRIPVSDPSSIPSDLTAGEPPRPEPTAWKLLIRGFALFALGFMGVYLAWRATSTINLAVWWIALPLLAVEIHNAFGLALYTIALWDVDVRPEARRVTTTPWRVAVLIPTYNESPDVLLPTIAASVALEPAHETWVLDDGKRDEIRKLAGDFGARYLTRPDNAHAKAGNLNHALDVVDADIVAVLDADHVPLAHFLSATLGYFDDPRMAFVQTPQDLYDLDSFEHQRGEGSSSVEEEVFYRVIAPAKNRWSAAFWCGTCSLVRVAALRSVGGVATESVTEDIHTTIRMYRRGWSGVFHNEVVARGLAPADAAAYMLQRKRWALGAMQVLRTENPLFGPGLTAGQRLAFLTTLFGWFDSWRMLAYMILPVLAVFTGAVPISAPGAVFVPLFLATLALQYVALRLLARGRYRPLLAVLFEVLRMPAVLPATLAILRDDSSRRFHVSPKGRQEGERVAVPIPSLLVWLTVACLAGAAWFAATVLGLTPLHYREPWAAMGAAGFLLINLALLVAAMRRIRAARFAGERRAGVRFPVQLAGTLDGRVCDVVDVSLTGARAFAEPDEAAAIGERPRLTLDLGDGELALACTVRRRGPLEHSSVELGLQFLPGQRSTVARLALALFQGDTTPELETGRELGMPSELGAIPGSIEERVAA